MTRAMCAVVFACAVALSISTANANPRHQTLTYCAADQSYRTTCGQAEKRIQRVAVASGDGVIIGSRPPGCPYRFCGCEASLYKFGRIIPELNLAANWIRKFPRTSPAPGMAAAKVGHVMILLSHVEGDNWMAHDGNSGGGLTRRHVQSIRGYVIVNPDATRMASQ